MCSHTYLKRVLTLYKFIFLFLMTRRTIESFKIKNTCYQSCRKSFLLFLCVRVFFWNFIFSVLIIIGSNIKISKNGSYVYILQKQRKLSFVLVKRDCSHQNIPRYLNMLLDFLNLCNTKMLVNWACINFAKIKNSLDFYFTRFCIVQNL